ncbi:MAG: hypothetical protein V7641_1474 [Blastocatellia bacterium]
MAVQTLLAQPQARPASLMGDLKDQNGDFVIGAKLTLKDSQNQISETISDEHGRFHFANLAAGRYTLQVILEGFAAHEEAININLSSPEHRLQIVLRPTINEALVVNDEGLLNVSIDPQNAAGAQTLKEKEISALPDDPDRFAEQLQLLATSSGSAPGQATTTVDGFVVEGRLPPKSAIREVRINPDLFSAEYDKAPYQGGRIQIFTKPGALAFNGSTFFNFNNSALNAREVFAPARLPQSTQRYGFELGGPIIKKRLGFLVDFEGRDIGESATVNAIVLNPDFQPTAFVSSIPTPKRLLLGSGRVDWQINPLNTFIVRYDYSSSRLSNQGVGGFNLPDRAFDSDETENSLKLSDTTTLSAKILNEARVGITNLHIEQQAGATTPTISIPGAFTAGGASVQFERQKRWRIEMVDNLSIIAGKHSVKFGVQLLDNQVDDFRTDNFNGSFIFGGVLAPRLDSAGQVISGPNGPVLEAISGLEQYRRTLLHLPGGQPTRFSIASGDPSAIVNQWRLAGFIQDEWRLRPNLSISLGLRYEGQTSPSNKLSLAPRAGIAYSPDKQRQWIVRGRIGLFYDRIAESLSLEAERLDGRHQQQIIIDSPAFPDPATAATANHAIATTRQFADDLHPPRSLQMQVAVEHQLPRGWKFQASQSWSYGRNALRSRNLNAPILDSLTDTVAAQRPFGVDENILEFESTGKVDGQVFFVGVNQASNKYFNIYSGYLFFNFHSDTDSPFILPQSSYTLEGEWARPSWQARHRAFVVALLNMPWAVRASISVNAASGTPFNITTGRDNNGDGSFTDRPDVVDLNDPNAIVTRYGVFDADAINGNLPRNLGTNPFTMTVDLNLSRTFVLGNNAHPAEPGKRNDRQYRLTINARASNVLNHTNLTGLNGVITSPFFGLANNALAARRIEFGMRFSF